MYIFTQWNLPVHATRLAIFGVWDSRVVARSCCFCFHSSSYLYFSWEIVVFKITVFLNEIRLSISKRVLKSRLSSQTWYCDVLGCNKPCGRSLPSGAWSSRTNVNLKPQTSRQGPGYVTSWLPRFSPEMLDIGRLTLDPQHGSVVRLISRSSPL